MKAAAVFLGFFGLYLFTMPPSLAPYRDAGEMATSAHTLGVSHPTGYPLYILIGRMSQEIPLGNGAYRLNILTALAGAGAVGLIFAGLSARFGLAAGLATALLLGLNPTFWTVAKVQEMYSLWMLGAVGLMLLGWKAREAGSKRLWLGWCFLFGLALTNRLDLLLWAPGLLWLALSREESSGWWAVLAFLVVPGAMILGQTNMPIVFLIGATALWLGRGERRDGWVRDGLICGALGLSLYLYLPVRSATGPWLDWNHPADLKNLLESLLRSKYGGTLDLLSKNYRPLELIGPTLSLYGKHLWAAFGPLGLGAAVLGGLAAWRAHPGRALGQAACWWWSGPVFLAMANLPPNPHAAAIVEPHYLLGDLVLVFFAAEGAATLGAWKPLVAWAVAAAFVIRPFYNGTFEQRNFRDNYFMEDHSRNVFLSAPEGAVLVAKKDVQVFGLWYEQVVNGRRPDLKVVAQGLSGSPWYQESWRKRGSRLRLRALRSKEDWTEFSRTNGPVYATQDAEIPPEIRGMMKPRGLVEALAPAAPEANEALWELISRRGDYSYEAQADFFSADLVDSHAQARYRMGTVLHAAGRVPEAERAFALAWAWHWRLPEAAVFLGFSAFARRDYGAAARHYGAAARVFDDLLAMAEEFHSLPELKAGLRRTSAETLTHLGVISERQGDRAGAEAWYAKALARQPLSQTRYNLGSLYWGKDDGRALLEFEEALKLDPGNGQAARYLAVLRARRSP